MDFNSIMDEFERRYPNQGINRNLKPEYEHLLAMWIVIFGKAKEGKFDEIRPDMAVQLFPKLKCIYDHYCNFKHG